MIPPSRRKPISVTRPTKLSAEDLAKIAVLRPIHLKRLQNQIDTLERCGKITAEDLRITILPVRNSEKGDLET